MIGSLRWLKLLPWLAIAILGGGFSMRGARIDALKADVLRIAGERDGEASAHRQTKSNMKLAVETANAKAQAARLAKETLWKENADETESRLRGRLADALKAVAFAERGDAERSRRGVAIDHRPGSITVRLQPETAPARTGTDDSGGSATLSQTARATIDPSGTGRLPELDAGDLRICTANTIKAQGWQEFYEGIVAR